MHTSDVVRRSLSWKKLFLLCRGCCVRSTLPLPAAGAPLCCFAGAVLNGFRRSLLKNVPAGFPAGGRRRSFRGSGGRSSGAERRLPVYKIPLYFVSGWTERSISFFRLPKGMYFLRLFAGLPAKCMGIILQNGREVKPGERPSVRIFRRNGGFAGHRYEQNVTFLQSKRKNSIMIQARRLRKHLSRNKGNL